jgi:small GTP-binding protein
MKKNINYLHMSYYFYNKKYKIIFIGDSSVGKTSILKKYIYDDSNCPTTTIGTEFAKKYVTKYNLHLQIWDCAGQERFRALCKIYFRDTDICILVFDLSNTTTLESIKNYWINTYLQNSTKHHKFILVGNKSDLNVSIDYNIIWDLVKTYNMKYIETSVNNNTNITNLFDLVCEFILEINNTNNFDSYNLDSYNLDSYSFNSNNLDISQNSNTLDLTSSSRYNYWSSYC